MVKGFFFDLDGTLVDTHRANFEAYQRAIKEVSGVDITWENFKETIGHVAKTSLPTLIPKLDEKMFQRIVELKADYYKDLMHLTQLNTNLIAFMDVMKDAEIVLVTTAKRRNAEAVLAHHKLTKYFDHIITGDDVEQSKPAPDAYELALSKTGLSPHEAIAFEDSDTGRQAAEAAGLQVIMVSNFTV